MKKNYSDTDSFLTFIGGYMKIKSIILTTLLIAVISFQTIYGEKLIIFHAGSLTVPFKELKTAFEKTNPNVQVLLEASGSRKAARKISDIHRNADIMASADYKVIDELLMPEYADWNILFASNAMTLMFSDKSKYAEEIDVDNWSEILLRKGVEYGHSDPNVDPCGYRSLMVWQLESKRLDKPWLYDSLKSHCPIRNIRPKSVELIALLEVGEYDYIFEYESVSKQHNGKYIVFNDSCNLSDNDLGDFYKNAIVQVTGKNIGEYTTLYGAPIVYGITITKNAEHRTLAIEFIKLMLSDEGRDIFRDCGQKPLEKYSIKGDTSNLSPILKEVIK